MVLIGDREPEGKGVGNLMRGGLDTRGQVIVSALCDSVLQGGHIVEHIRALVPADKSGIRK
jgi:hypothetical protein